jgi:hypothetical protein
MAAWLAFADQMFWDTAEKRRRKSSQSHHLFGKAVKPATYLRLERGRPLAVNLPNSHRLEFSSAQLYLST